MTLTPFALVVVLACALSFAGLDLMRKRMSHDIRPSPLLVFMGLGQSPLFLLWWLISDGGAMPGPGYLQLALLSIVINIVANLAMLESMRISPLSVTIPLLSLTPVFTTLLAIPLLDQVPTPWQWAGVIIVVIGAFLLVPLRFAGSFRIDRGSLLMMLTAFLWSLSGPVDRLGIDASSPSLHGLVLSVGVAAGVILWLFGKGRAGELRGFRGRERMLSVTIGFGAAALALQLVAMTLTWLSLIETAKRAVGNVTAVILGRAVFGEPITGRKLIAVVVMALGVALVLW